MNITCIARRGIIACMRRWGLLGLFLCANTATATTISTAFPKNYLHKISLLEALEIGLSQQVSVVKAHVGITQAEAQKLSAISSFIPSLSVGDQVELYKPIGKSGNTIIASTLVPAEHGIYYNAVTANFKLNIFSGGKDMAAYRAAMDAIQSANSTLRETVNKVFVLILTDYVALTKDEVTIAKQKKIVTLDQNSAWLTQARYQHGMASRIDWISAEQTVLQAQTQLDQDLQQEDSDQESLVRAMGYTQSLATFTTNINIPNAPNAAFKSLGQINDPAIEAARDQISEAQQQVYSARAGFWPTLSLIAQYNWLGINASNTLNAITGTKGSNYMLGVALSIPLLPAMNVVASVQSAQAGVVNAIGNYDNTLSTVSSRMNYATEMYRDAMSATKIATRADELAKENVTLTINRYLAKQGNKIEVNQAKSLLMQSAIARQTSKLSETLAKWVLFRASHQRQFAHRLLAACGSVMSFHNTLASKALAQKASHRHALHTDN